MQNLRFVCAALAAVTLAMPVFAAGKTSTVSKQNAGVQPWYGTKQQQQYQKAMQNIYAQTIAGSGMNSPAINREAKTAVAAPPAGPRWHNAAGDYLSEMVASSVDRWSPSQPPLRVFIGGGDQGFRSSFPGLFASAMNEWASASNGKIRWTRASDPSSADITVQWNSRVNGSEPESGETRTRFGVGPEGYRVITHASISIVTMPNGAAVTDAEMRKICLHEIGHALGLKHSSNTGDIMYWQSNGAQLSALGPRDATTINRLYSN